MFYYLLCSEIKSSTIPSAIMNLIFLVNILLSVFSIHATASSFSPVDKKEENATHTNMNPSFLDMIEGRIVNGETVDAGTYPWFTRLSNGNSLVCGGFLVSKRYVLTAAHCSNYFNKAQVGALRYPYRYGSNGGQFVEEFSIEESIIHPNFNTNTLNNDFLLVKLRGTSSIDPVKIDDGSYSPHYTDETNLWSIGRSSDFFKLFQTGHISHFKEMLKKLDRHGKASRWRIITISSATCRCLLYSEK